MIARTPRAGSRPDASRVSPSAGWLAGAASILLPVAAALAEPVAYAASYTVRVYGLRGELRIEQAPAPDAAVAGAGEALAPVWRFRSMLEARGIAKLFVRGETVEDGLFAVREDGRLRPLAVHVDDNISDERREVTFHWPPATAGGGQAQAQAHAAGTYDGQAFDMAVPDDVLDRALLMPAVALDLAANGRATDADGDGVPTLSASYEPGLGYRLTVLEEGELREYFAEPVGRETLDGPDGALETVVFRHQRQGSSRRTTFWLAPALGYAPARIEQQKVDKDNPHLRAELKEYRTLDPGSVSTASGR